MSTSIGCRAGHPTRGPSLEVAMSVGTHAPLDQMLRNARERNAASPATGVTPLTWGSSPKPPATPRRWEGRSPIASPPSSPTSAQARMLFGRTHASRPQQPSPRLASPAARGQQNHSGRSWTPIMQRHVHLDSWEPKQATTSATVSKLADVTTKFHKKPVGDNNTRRVNAHAALLRMLAREAQEGAEPSPDPEIAAVAMRTMRLEDRADADRWFMQPPNEATMLLDASKLLNRNAEVMGTRELAGSWAENELAPSSSAGWSQGFAASSRGRTNIYAHRAAAARPPLHDSPAPTPPSARRSARSGMGSGGVYAAHPAGGMVGWAGTPHSPRIMSPGTCAEAEAMRQLLGSGSV